jgi:biotin transport system substrate-specific component
MLVYLCEGAAGLPVFSPTGPGGLAQLLGPTGGFLLAYPFVALITGAVAKTMRSRFSPFSAAAVSCSLATAFLFLVGALWLGREAHLSAHVLWMAAVAPFLPGEVIKILAVSGTYRALARPSSR